MAKKLRRCTDAEISNILDSNSDTDTSLESSSKSLSIRQNHSLGSCEIHYDTEVGSKTSEIRNNQTSLKLKLRRSTEHSLYKINTDSECESFTQKSYPTIVNDLKKNIKVLKFTETTESLDKPVYFDTNLKSDTVPIVRCVVNNNKISVQDENKEVSRYRLRRPPVKYTDYECFTSISSTTRILRSQKTVNYINDHKLFYNNRLLHTEKKCPKRLEKANGNAGKRRETDVIDTNGGAKVSRSIRKNIVANKENKSDIELQSKTSVLSPRKPCTPKHSNLTPSLGRRSNVLPKPSTPLQEARSKLHISLVPKSLPCREGEFNTIFTFLEGKLKDSNGGCMYISGVPGTGKTATVNEAIKCLKRLVSKGKLKQFDFIEINGMKLPEPRQAYVEILKQLTGDTLTWEQAYQTLEKRFYTTTIKESMTLLLVDELDLLYTKRQDVVYNLLDWPTKISAQLVVITIANTMDLPERVLMGRVTSRLGLTRLTFQPYSYIQLQEIVSTRLKDFDAFKNEAIELVTRKVAAVSGDARRALDICRRAIEIAETRNGKIVSMQDISDAFTEMIATSKVQAIKHCSKMEQIFLEAIRAEVGCTGTEDVSLMSVYKQIGSLCSLNGIKIPTVTETLDICGRLSASRVLICNHSKGDIHQRILLNVSADDIHYALRETDLD